MFSKEVLANPDAAYPHCHCATIVRLSCGDLLVAWYAYPQEETRGGVLILARKRANGARFDRPRRILAELNSSLGNPWTLLRFVMIDGLLQRVMIGFTRAST